jgi:prepilin-type N-terminal cleavage/methylation domain-containing protein
MKNPRIQPRRKGFTLMELMVAMAITTIIITVLVSVTSIAIDTWNRSRSELRAARQAKSMVDTMARDLESLVTRRGNEYEWLSAKSANTSKGPNGLSSTNSADLIFFSGSTDRYDGNIGGSKDQGGDVSCVGYRLFYKDPLEKSGDFETFVLNRIIVNPDKTFTDLLGQNNLENSFNSYASQLEDEENFVCENVFQFTVTFQVEVTQGTGNSAKLVTVPVKVGQTSSSSVTDSFKIKGTGIETSATGNGVSADELKSGRVKSVEISLTVITDSGIDQIRRGGISDSKRSEFMAKNSYQYTKLIQVPSM